VKYTLETLAGVYGIVKMDTVPDLHEVIRSSKFMTFSKTDKELSLVAEWEALGSLLNDDSLRWKGFRFGEVLDFSLKGILAKISRILASADIGIFVISTYDTDYVLVQEEDFERAISVLVQDYIILR